MYICTYIHTYMYTHIACIYTNGLIYRCIYIYTVSLSAKLSTYAAGTELGTHMFSNPQVLFFCVSTVPIIPIMYDWGVSSAGQVLARQSISEVLEERELEQDFERWAGCLSIAEGWSAGCDREGTDFIFRWHNSSFPGPSRRCRQW